MVGIVITPEYKYRDIKTETSLVRCFLYFSFSFAIQSAFAALGDTLDRFGDTFSDDQFHNLRGYIKDCKRNLALIKDIKAKATNDNYE